MPVVPGPGGASGAGGGGGAAGSPGAGAGPPAGSPLGVIWPPAPVPRTGSPLRALSSKNRTAAASVNFVTAHDGFTLRDLVTYNVKHNGANGESNRDGSDDNRSWNCGVEGETDDEAVNALRHRQTQNLMATLILSSGVPMITAGDELGRTQQGNNNAYCQDSPISWVHWDTQESWGDLTDLTRKLLQLRAEVFDEGRRDGGRLADVHRDRDTQ